MRGKKIRRTGGQKSSCKSTMMSAGLKLEGTAILM